MSRTVETHKNYYKSLETPKNAKNSSNSNIHTISDQKNKLSYEDLEAISITAIDSFSQTRDRCLSAESKIEVLEKLLNEAQEAINSRDLKLNNYEGKEFDPSYLKKFEELKSFISNDERFEEIRRKKMEDMKKKHEEILRQKYNFAPRY